MNESENQEEIIGKIVEGTFFFCVIVVKIYIDCKCECVFGEKRDWRE